MTEREAPLLEVARKVVQKFQPTKGTRFDVVAESELDEALGELEELVGEIDQARNTLQRLLPSSGSVMSVSHVIGHCTECGETIERVYDDTWRHVVGPSLAHAHAAQP